MADVIILNKRMRAVGQKMYNPDIFFGQVFVKIFIYFLKKAVWKDLEENQLRHQIKRGLYKWPPNLLLVRNLEGVI